MPMAPDETIVSKIAEQVGKGECILFLGAGIHSPPPPDKPQYSYPENERPPLGRKLSERLAKECDFKIKFPKEDSGNLQRVSLCYELENSRQRLVDRIRNFVHDDKKPSPALCALAKMNFPLIITTNFDQLLERALWTAGKTPVPGIYNKNDQLATSDRDATVKEPFVFKIHGDIMQPESLVITDEDYIDFVMRMSNKDIYHPVPETFRFYFNRWPTLFVGYSLLDYNLRLLFKTLRWKVDKARKIQTYSVDPYPDPLISKVLSSDQHTFVTFIAQDVWTFVPKLYPLVKNNQEMPQSC